MKRLNFLLLFILLSALVLPTQAQDEIISLFEGSTKMYDDAIGFETHYYLTGPTSHKAIDGKIRRQFCQLPKGVSAYELIKNYEKAIQSKGGEIIYFSRDVKRYKLNDGEVTPPPKFSYRCVHYASGSETTMPKRFDVKN